MMTFLINIEMYFVQFCNKNGVKGIKSLASLDFTVVHIYKFVMCV